MVETVINQNDGFVSITATGGETSLSGDFPIYSKSHVTIKRTRSSTTTTLVLNTDYTIADNQLEVTSGFTAVLAGSATPAVAADVYTLLLDVPESRTTDFTQAGDFFAADLNQELDLTTQQIQQLRRDVDKSAHLSDTSTITSVVLPDPEDGKLIGWDGTDGTMANFDIDDLGGIPVSSFAIELLNDTSASAMRATLGSGTIGDQLFLTSSTSGAQDIIGLNSAGWSSYTPVITAGSGTIASYSATGKFTTLVNKAVALQLRVAITSNGTGSGSVISTLPLTASANKCIMAGRADQTSGKMLQATIDTGNSLIGIINYDNTYPAVTGEVLYVSGIYERT